MRFILVTKAGMILFLMLMGILVEDEWSRDGWAICLEPVVHVKADF
jgi:hypothetical protein